MINIVESGLTYDDVMLKPRKNKKGSRFGPSVSTDTQLTPRIPLDIPIVTANMDTITEHEMANTMQRMGGLGIIHRFMTKEHQAHHLGLCHHPRVACIGVSQLSRERLKHILLMVDKIDAVLIDIAHGHCNEMLDQVKWCRDNHEDIDIIAGNIATAKAAEDLIAAGADCLKVGVGPGSLCTTRINTGNGVPQITAIDHVCEVTDQYDDVTVIADGGIRHSGDMIKALAVGADAVMIGGLLAGTTETPGETFTELDGTKYKIYRGMASRDAQRSWKGTVTSVEGESKRVKAKGTVRDVITDLVSNLRSGMTYQDASNLRELVLNAEFVRQTSAGALEARAHGLL